MTEEELIWKEEVTEYLGEHWTMEGRPDLFRDMIEHVLKVYPEFVGDGWKNNYISLLIKSNKFLQTLCRDAVSSEDLEFQYQQSLSDKERMIFTP